MEKRKLKLPTPGPSAPSQMHGYDTSASAWYALSCDTSGNLSIKQAMTIEVEGVGINTTTFLASATGTTTLKTATAAQVFKMKKIFVSPAADMSGTIAVSLGIKTWKFFSPIKGGNHLLMSAGEDFEDGSAGGSIAVSLPGGIKAFVTPHYGE